VTWFYPTPIPVDVSVSIESEADIACCVALLAFRFYSWNEPEICILVIKPGIHADAHTSPVVQPDGAVFWRLLETVYRTTIDITKILKSTA